MEGCPRNTDDFVFSPSRQTIANEIRSKNKYADYSFATFGRCSTLIVKFANYILASTSGLRCYTLALTC